MHEFPRPVTRSVHVHLEHQLPAAQDKIIEFQETQKPTVLWWDEWSETSASFRDISLNCAERDTAIQDVLRLCGIGDDFHRHVRLLKNDTGEGNLRNIVWANEQTFGEHKPSFTEIFNWLGDLDRVWPDEPNTYDVGIALESPLGLVVAKWRSEEPFTDGDDIEISTQIALYPTDDWNKIRWYVQEYNPSA